LGEGFKSYFQTSPSGFYSVDQVIEHERFNNEKDRNSTIVVTRLPQRFSWWFSQDSLAGLACRLPTIKRALNQTQYCIQNHLSFIPKMPLLHREMKHSFALMGWQSGLLVPGPGLFNQRA
jgi:hypothetical protein